MTDARLKKAFKGGGRRWFPGFGLLLLAVSVWHAAHMPYTSSHDPGFHIHAHDNAKSLRHTFAKKYVCIKRVSRMKTSIPPCRTFGVSYAHTHSLNRSLTHTHTHLNIRRMGLFHTIYACMNLCIACTMCDVLCMRLYV
jgi:hypothetical protein